MDDTDRDLGCLETFKLLGRDYRSGETVNHFEFSYKDSVDADLAQQAAIGLAITHVLNHHA